MQINNVWYLGIDFGTTSLSAVLLNAETRLAYPIYWTVQRSPNSTKYSFRNPAVAYSGILAPSDRSQSPIASIAVGMEASTQASSHSGVFIQKFKPFLKIAIPYYSPRINKWEPVLQWSAQQPVSLYWIVRALQALLATIEPVDDAAASVKVGAWGLSDAAFADAQKSLSGVILGSPAGWGDIYRFNLREAVLGAGLVRESSQIFFIEDAIATVLAELEESKVKNPIPNSQFPIPKSLRGGTLVVNAGAATTELALVDLPDDLQELTHSDFIIRSFPYGGNAIDQDIICQLLLRQDVGDSEEIALPLLDRLCSIAPDFELPQPGEPSLETRDRLQQQLQSSPVGLALLEAAEKLKRILQNQEEFTLNLGEQKYVCARAALENKVILPFVKSLNQELNLLLSQTKLSAQGIYRVICSGGTSALSQMRELLQQKFPNGTIIKDEVKNVNSERTSDFILNTSKVACGLANLPLYPQVLERSRQQYSDYFLLLELLRTFPDKPVSVREIMQLLERRGINTRACEERIIAILEGELLEQLAPRNAEAIWLTEASRQSLDYQKVQAAPLFCKEGARYSLDRQQCDRLRHYLTAILSGTYQKLEEPLSHFVNTIS